MSDFDSDTDIEEEEQEEEDLVGKYLGKRNALGQRHGKGWAILPNGDQYDGDYRRGQRHGYGLYVFTNGARYLGRYRCGKKSGEGKFLYPDGSFYDGCWRKNLKHGQGTYIYPNGDIYKGNWRKGLRHGVGIYIYKTGDVCFKGTWNHGIQDGPAELHFREHKFHGSWDYQYPQGPGIFTFRCKYMLNGYYKSEPKNIVFDNENLETEEGEAILEEGENEDDDIKSDKDKQYKLIRNLISPPLWYSQDIEKYDYSKLPQQPLPIPISDSEESVCDLSRETSQETELIVEIENIEAEECEVLCENELIKSISISTGLCSIDDKSMI